MNEAIRRVSNVFAHDCPLRSFGKANSLIRITTLSGCELYFPFFCQDGHEAAGVQQRLQNTIDIMIGV